MSVTTAALNGAVHNGLDELRAELQSTARTIHGLAETSWNEHESSRLLAALLERHGFTVQLGAAGMPTAFVAERGQGGACVAFVCEYDALRGLGHGCGHNLIGTASAGAGIALAEALAAADLPGSVRVVGSPAEEDTGGKIPFCRNGSFDDVDAALIFHPGDRTYSVMWALALTHWRWAFIGREAHAAGDPHQGLNALDAFVHAYTGVSLWRQGLRDGARVHGCIFEGGTAPNIIPARTSGEYIARARDAGQLAEMNLRFRAIFEAAALATGCTLDLELASTFDDLQSNPALARRCNEHLAAVGLDVQQSIPWDRVGSTDVGNMSYVVPTLHPEIAIAPEGVSCHTIAFREAANSERGYAVLMQAAEALARLGGDVVSDAALRAEVRSSFEAAAWHRREWRGSGA